MAKLALCMKASNAPLPIVQVREQKTRRAFQSQSVISAILAQTDISMEDRAVCETDPSLLQFIPYITVLNPQGKIFNYSRGSGSGEERLKSKLSIGLGGHVDSLPPEGVSLLDHLRAEAVRELQEEIGLTIPADDPALVVRAILVDATSPVDEVHIGIHCTYQVQDDGTDRFNLEENVIEKGEFSTLHNLTETSKFARLENWSRLAIDVLE